MSRVPRIRFKGFEEDWEQRKLGEIGSVAMCRRVFKYQTKESGDIPFFKIGSFGATPDAFIPKDLFEKLKMKYPYPEKGDVLISASGSIGRTVVFTGKDEYFQDSNIVWLKHDNSIINHFLKYLYSIVKWVGIEGTTIKRLYNDNILKTEVIIPTLSEQQKVSNYLDGLDHLITLHQRKLEKLKIIKKSMLENLFPQNGEKTPKIRFSGFTEDWEQRKFVELFLEKRDKTQSEDEDVLLSCAITGIYLNSELFSHFRGTSNIGYLKIKKNDLILSAQNLHLGNANVNLLFEHGIISPAYKVYELNKCDQYFVQSWVKKDSTKDFFLNATTEGASQCRKNIDWCILNNQLIVIPSLYEQFRIGKLFNSLNHLITLHQSKLEKLQKIKKSMLESMFV